MKTKYRDYVTFIIGADIKHEELYSKFETTDCVYGESVRLAAIFELSEFNTIEKSLYDCVQDFLNDYYNKEV